VQALAPAPQRPPQNACCCLAPAHARQLRRHPRAPRAVARRMLRWRWT
jgi:hypothetical protein